MGRLATTLPTLAALVLASSVGGSPPAKAEAGTPGTTATSDASLDGVDAQLDVLAKWVSQRGGRLSASIIDVGSGKTLAEHEAHVALNPASNMKILTAAGALDLLGPTFSFRTELHGRLRQGEIRPLVLRGFGDPSLTTASLWRLARSLASRGVRVVGDIRVDQSHFDDRFVPPAFEQQPNEWAAFRAPVSAVALNGNTVTLNVLATQAGSPARVWFDPPGVVTVEGEVMTDDPKTGQRIALTMTENGLALTGAVSGFVAAGTPRLRFERRAGDPRLIAGQVLAELLRREGVQVEGSVTLGGEDVHRRLTYVESEPLSVLLRELGKRSDNFYAEMILKTIGAVTARPATSAAGASALSHWLATVTPLDPGTRIVNGSGLFDADRLSSHELTAVLRRVHREPKIGAEFLTQLAVAGVDGTLRARLKNHASRHVVRAKSGTLDRVISLSGYVLSPPDRAPLAFSMIVEGIAGAHYATRRRIDGVVDAVVAHAWR